LHCLSGENHAGATGGARSGWFAHDNLDISPQTIHALDHLGFADAPKLTAQHAREFGLWHAENLSGPDLRGTAMLEDLADLGCQGRFNVHLSGARQSEPMASKTNRQSKKILQSINCFVQSSNEGLKYSTVQSLTKVATLAT
jgi:hypothetical protein